MINTKRRMIRLPRILLALCLLSMGAQAMAAAKAGENLEAGLPGLASRIDNIHSRIKLLESGRENDTSRLKSLEHYKRALAYLMEADNYARKTALFKAALSAASGQVKQIRQELARAISPATKGKPDRLSTAALPELEQRLVQQRAEQLTVENKLSELENRVAEEQSRPAKIQVELTGLQREQDEPGLSRQTAESALISEAQQAEQESHRQMLVNHADMHQQELLSHDMRLQLLIARRDLASREVETGELRVKRLQEIVNQRRSELANRLSLETDLATDDASGKFPLIREVTEQNAELSRQLTLLTTQTEQAINRRDTVAENLKQLGQRFRNTQQQLEFVATTGVLARQRLEFVDTTGVLGELLRGEQTNLADVRISRRETAGVRNEIAQAGLDRLQTEIQQRALGDEEQQLNQELLTLIDVALSEPERQALRSELRQLLQDRGRLLQAVADANNSYLQALHGLDGELKMLADTTDRFSILLDKRLLWVSSTSIIGISWPGELRRSLTWFFSPSSWTDIADTFLREARGRPLLSLFVLIAAVGLFGGRRRMSRRLDDMAQYIGNVQNDRISYTFEALGITLLLATPWPLLMTYVGWLLEHSPVVPGSLSAAAGSGLLAGGAVLFLLSTYRWLVKNRGVAEIHFSWSDQSRHVAWHNLRWFLIVSVPLVFVIFMAEAQDDELHRAAIGRLAFICASMALTLFAWRTLRPTLGAITASGRVEPDRWLWSTRYILLPLAVGFPIALILLAVTGYYYTALRLETRLYITLMGIFENFVFYNLLIRWLLVAQRRLALARARAKRSETRTATVAKRAVEASGDAVPEELDIPEVTLESISEQSRVLIRLATAAGLLLTFWWVWADIFPALGILDDFSLWSYQATIDGVQQLVPVTLKDLGLAIVTLLLTLITARNLSALFEVTLLSRLSSSPGTRYAALKLSRYAIVLAGSLVALNLIGLHWEQIQWLVAALGIGLGFGLQEVVMNFIYGLIILVERPIRVGDTITVGGVSGTVSQIRMRATTIVDWDNKALVVPNKTFIADQLINWTLTGPVTRLVIKVGIAYGSDTELAHRVLMDVAKANPLVLDDPAPTVFFLEFGDSALLFEMRVFVYDRLQRMPLTDDLHMAIDRAFREHGIEIAFPQLDVRMRTDDE